jgi:hypothetical protein
LVAKDSDRGQECLAVALVEVFAHFSQAGWNSTDQFDTSIAAALSASCGVTLVGGSSCTAA